MRVQRCRFRFLMTSFTVVDECLGIYPTVEGCGPIEPFNKSLPFSCYANEVSPLYCTYYLLTRRSSAVQVRRRSPPNVPMPVRQAVNRWLRTVRVDDRKQLFGPVCHVTFIELLLRFADTHAISNMVLRYSHTFMTIKALPNILLVCCVHLGWCHTNSAVKRVDVRSYKVL